MEKLEDMCDIVIYDGTPTSLVTDALIISRNVDTTIIVCAYNQTKMEELEVIKRDILNVGGKIAGVVINKMPTSRKEYYSSYYYGQSTTSSKRSSKNIDLKSRVRPNRQSNRVSTEEPKNNINEKRD